MGSMSCKERPSTATAGDETDEYIEAAVAETSELENGQLVQIYIVSCAIFLSLY